MSIQRIRLSQIQSNTVNYNHFEEQVIGMSIPYYEEYIATEGQIDFNVTTSYMVGNHSLKVFLGGVMQDIGISGAYIEIDEHTVRFNEALRAGEWVMFRIEGAGSGTTLENHKHHTREVPIGDVNGSNMTFVLNSVPRASSEMVFQNGVLLDPGLTGDYVISGKNISFNYAPPVGAKVRVTYMS